MKELSKFTLSIIKNTAKNVSSIRAKGKKIADKIAILEKELEDLNNSIEMWESPIKTVTGGYTSEQVVNNLLLQTSATEEETVIDEESPLNVFAPTSTNMIEEEEEEDLNLKDSDFDMV